MKLLPIGIFLMFCHLMAFGQTTENNQEFNDSISGYTELGETVVEASRSVTTANKLVVFPNKKEKASSIDAYGLLKRMTIPNINVGSNSVTSFNGEEVSIFINGIPASTDDMTGIDVNNISKVEYLDYPQDAKYLGAKHVINITTKEPEFGGFTKIVADGYYFNKFNYNALLMSKFNYKRMTYDITLSDNFRESNKAGTVSNQNYFFNDGTSLDQIQKTISSYNHTEAYAGRFRALYTSDKVVISNIIGLYYNKTPQSLESQLISFPKVSQEFIENSSLKTKALSPSWQGNYNFTLPKDFYLSFQGNFSYTHNNYNNLKESDEFVVFDNRVKEDAYGYIARLSLQKNLKKAGSLTLTGYYQGDIFSTHYNQSGVFSSQSVNTQYVAPVLLYGLQISRFMLKTQVGAIYIRNKVSDLITSTVTPQVILNGYWSKDSHSLSFNFIVGEQSYYGGMLNPTLLQTDNFMYSQGNPDLKTSPSYSGTWFYSFAPAKTVQLSTYGSFQYLHNPVTSVFIPKEDYLIHTYQNSGNYYEVMAAIKANWRPFNGNLVLDVVPMIVFSKVSGINSGKVVKGRFVADAIYYLKNWNFQVFYNHDSKQINSHGYITQTPSIYGLIIGWHKDNWNLEFSCRNPFRDSWVFSRTSFNSPTYSFTTKSLGEENSHREFVLKVAYTIGYGKKVSNETLETIDTSSSAIIPIQ